MKKNSQKLKRKKVASKSIKPIAVTNFESSWISISKPIISQVFLIIGVLGTCLTLIGNLQTLIFFADWIRVVTKWWFQLATSFWTLVIGWTGYKVYPETITVMTFYTMLQIVCFSGLIDTCKHREKAATKRSAIRNFSLHSLWSLDGVGSHLSWALATSSLAMLLFWFATELLILGEPIDFSKVFWIFLGSAMIWLGVLMGRGIREAMQSLAISFMIAAIYSILAIPAAKLAQSNGQQDLDFFRKVVIDYSLGNYSIMLGAYLSWASPDYLMRRFASVLGTVLLVLLMNWASISEVDIQPPLDQRSSMIIKNRRV